MLADSDPERELPSQQYGLRHRQRRASPNDRGECEKHKKDEEVDAFNRGPDGNYLTPISQLIETPLQQLMGSGEMVVEKRQNGMSQALIFLVPINRTSQLTVVRSDRCQLRRSRSPSPYLQNTFGQPDSGYEEKRR